MSLVKVTSKALQKLTAPPYYHSVRPDIAFSPGKGGIAGRLHKFSLYSELSSFDAGAKVVVSQLSKRCLYLSTSDALELKASYELILPGFIVLAGYLSTNSCSEASEKDLYHYKFHSNCWLTDEQLTALVVDID